MPAQKIVQVFPAFASEWFLTRAGDYPTSTAESQIYARTSGLCCAGATIPNEELAEALVQLIAELCDPRLGVMSARDELSLCLQLATLVASWKLR